METPQSSPDNSPDKRPGTTGNEGGADDEQVYTPIPLSEADAVDGEHVYVSAGQNEADDEHPDLPPIIASALENGSRNPVVTTDGAPGKPEGSKRAGPLAKFAGSMIRRHVQHQTAHLETTTHRAVNPSKKATEGGYLRHEQDASATASVMGIHELAEEKLRKRSLRFAESRAPEGHKRADVIKEIGREHAAQIVTVEETAMARDGQSPEEAEQERLHWAAVLDPRNVLWLRHHLVQKAVSEGIKESEIVWQIQADRFNNLYPVDIAHYLGVEPKDWISQRKHESGMVPDAVVRKLRQIIRMPQTALEELAFQYAPLNKTHGGKIVDGEQYDMSPFERVNEYEKKFRAEHADVDDKPGLDIQITAARANVAPYVYNPEHFKPRRPKEGGHKDKERSSRGKNSDLMFDPELVDEMSDENKELLLAIDREVIEALDDDRRSWGEDLDSAGKKARNKEVRNEIYRNHFPSIDDKNAASLLKTIKALKSKD